MLIKIIIHKHKHNSRKTGLHNPAYISITSEELWRLASCDARTDVMNRCRHGKTLNTENSFNAGFGSFYSIWGA